jgi:GTPase SAR1 family protein
MANIDLDIGRVEQSLRSCAADAHAIQRIQQIRDELLSTPIRIAVVGAFKAGKSTLCNALLGVDLLPTKSVPTTAAIAELQRGAESYELDTAAGIESIDRARFIEEVQRDAVRGAPPITVRGYLPAAILGDGVVLADTPGVGSFEEIHAEVTYAYLPKVDAVVLVVDGERGGLHTNDVAFVRDRLLQRVRDRLWVVVNRLNLKPEGDHASILAEVDKTLRTNAGLAAPRIFAVNALAAMKARVSGKSADGTGIDRLEAALQTEVFAQLRSLREQRARAQLVEVLSDAVAGLRAQAGALAFDDKAIDAQLKALREEQTRLNERVRTVEEDLHREQQRLMAEVDSRIKGVVANVANRSAQYLNDIESKGSAEGELQLGNSIQGDLMRGMETLFRDWLEPELLERLRRFGKDIDDKMSLLKQALPTIDLSGVRVGPNPYLVAGVEIGLNVLLNAILPGEWLVAIFARVVGKKALDPVVKAAVQWVSKLLGGVLKSGVALQMAKQINDVAPLVSAEVQDQVRRAFANAKAAVRDDIKRRVQDIETALEAARGERAKGEQSVATERSRLLGIVRELEGLAAALRTEANHG